MNTNTTLNVSGMSCNHCVMGVTKALQALRGVENVRVSLEDASASVAFDEKIITVEILEQAIVDAGFSITPGAVVEKEVLPLIQPVPPEPVISTVGVKGMSCVNCANSIEKAFKGASHIHRAVVNFPMERLMVEHDGSITLKEIMATVSGAGFEAHTIETGVGERANTPQDSQVVSKERFRFFFALILTAPLTILMMTMPFGHTVTNYIMFVLSTLVQFVSGRTFYEGAWHSLKSRSTNMDVLIALGISAAYFYSVFSLFFMDPSAHTFFDSSAMLITFIMLGKMIEARATAKTGHALEKLLSLQADTANRIKNGSEERVPASVVRPGDRVRVRPGETVPVDGKICKGATTLDESMITGESIPVDRKMGDTVIGATINKTGVIEVEAVGVGEATMLARIVKLVGDAQADKAPIQRLADAVSNVFVPFVVAAALITFVFWYGFVELPVPVGSTRFLFAFQLMIAVLVVACPCALGLATPTAIMVGSGVGLKRGILFKRASVLETISKLDIILFDKTGTITRGEPVVSSVHPLGNRSADQLLSMAASVSENSNHPLARAVVNHALARGIRLAPATDQQEIAGQGTTAMVDGERVMVGNQTLMESTTGLSEEATALGHQLAQKGESTIYVQCDNKIIGIIALVDSLKPDSKRAVKTLQDLGIKTALISGDNSAAAHAVAAAVGIETVEAEVLPQDKINRVKEWQDKGLTVGMAGDGINDAPALAQADIGIAVGSGTDIAKETGDVVLVNDTLMDVERAIRLGRKTLSTIKMNFFWAFFYNILMIPIAAGVLYPATGIVLKPEWACIAMWFSSLTVVGNSLLLNRFAAKLA
jgi:P-type Cu+ transporter